jgi:hypothetical protein
MSRLAQFSAPAELTELSDTGLASWSARVQAIFRRVASEGDYPQFYDPLDRDTPADRALKTVTWFAFPARLLSGATSERERWQKADASRNEQDEYCEWTVQRGRDGKIRRVVFTCEVPEYWSHLHDDDPDLLLALYEQFAGRAVRLDELRSSDGRYVTANPMNAATSGDGLVHLTQRTNNLYAAISLVAGATILRQEPDGTPVTNQQQLVTCGRLGDPRRNSDPQIAAAVNNLASQGMQITLADPAGLYIAGLVTGEMEAPGGADPAQFWTIERGTPERALRASYEVPAEFGFSVGDIMLGGRPIEFGAQLADNVQIKVTAIAAGLGSFSPQRYDCVRP